MSNYRTIDNNNIETYNEEKGGGEYAIEENRSPISSITQSGEISRKERNQNGIFGRGLSENKGNSRISFERTTEIAQGKSGEGKTREINGDELSYNLTPEEEINENAYKAVKGLRDIGIETDVYSGDIYINGNPRQKAADATTVSDEFILVNNNAELSAEEMIAHEGFHYHYNKGNKQAIEYQSILLENIDIFDEKIIDLLDDIRGIYDVDKVNTELAAYFSGWLNEDAEGTIQEYKSALINPQAVLDAHKAFMADIQQNKIAVNNGTSDDVSFNFAQNQEKNHQIDNESEKIRESAVSQGKEETIKNIEEFASKRGLKVKYYQAPADSVGNGFIDKDTIYINVQDSNVMYKTAIHETLHGLKNNNRAEYQKLYNQIRNYAEGNAYLKDYAERVMISYTDPTSPAHTSIFDENGEINQDVLSEEVLAKLCEEVIQDPVSFIEKVNKNRNVLTAISDLLRKIKNNLATKLTNSEKARLDNALLEIEKYMRGVSDSTTTLKYHISDTASDEIDRVLRGKNNTNEVKLRDYTPSILVEHGVKDLPMLMNARHLRENILTEQQAKEQGYTFNIGINYHGLGKELFMKVIDSLDNPERVYRGTKKADNSARKENYFLIITTVTDDDGNKINVPVHINQTGLYNNLFVESNKIATVFGRKNINEYINREIKKGNLVLVKKKGGLSIKSLSPIDRHLDNTTYVDSIQYERQNINGNNLLENGTNNANKKSINISNQSNQTNDFKGLTIQESIEKISKNSVTAKSADIQSKAENTLIKSISNAFGVPYADKQGIIKDMVKSISQQVKSTGKIDNDEINKIMDTAFEKGKIIDDNFSQQYSSLKKELRDSKFKYIPTEVFQEMRKKYFGKLIFSKDGIDVDILYKEFSENYPELFSSSIVNPEDQIVRIGEVYDSLKAKEMSLEKYYGESSDEYREFIKQDLQYAINKYVKELNQVEKFEADNRRIITEKEQHRANYKPMTQEEYKAAQKKVYEAQKAYDRVLKDILLTEKDKKIVDTLVNGGDPNLVTGDNRNEIITVYSAKKALEDAKKPIRQYKQDITQQRNDTADNILKTFRAWKDKKIGLAYSTETFERNIRDIVPDSKVSQNIIDTYISPIHKSEAESNRLKNSLRERIKALDLDTGDKKLYDITVYDDNEPYKMKVNESSLVQLLGEKKITEKQVEKLEL